MPSESESERGWKAAVFPCVPFFIAYVVQRTTKGFTLTSGQTRVPVVAPISEIYASDHHDSTISAMYTQVIVCVLAKDSQLGLYIIVVCISELLDTTGRFYF